MHMTTGVNFLRSEAPGKRGTSLQIQPDRFDPDVVKPLIPTTRYNWVATGWRHTLFVILSKAIILHSTIVS